MSWRLGSLVVVASLAGGCAPVDLGPDPESTPLEVGQSREVELRFLRLDVVNFEEELTREDLLALPKDVQEQLWLLDLDMSNSPNTPHLLDNALTTIQQLDPATLGPAERNMQRLLTMTPDTVDLTGTSVEQLIELSPLIGVAAARILADLCGIDPSATFLEPEIVAGAVLDFVVKSHPNALVRRGPKTVDHPDGLYDVSAGGIPITLADVAADFTTLPEKFGPVFVDGVYHPGFVVGEVRARVLTDDFKITARANANALPFKGVDLTSATTASVSSLRFQGAEIFDFDDPSWLVIEGLVEGDPVIESMTIQIVEDDAFIPGGRSPFPEGYGSSSAWQLPQWTLERVLIGAARRGFGHVNADLAYSAPHRDEPLFTGLVTSGWQELLVQGGLGSPPPPSYLWDVLVEVAQVRLHDGIEEGDADLQFEIREVPVGINIESIEQSIRRNLEADPTALVDVAANILDTTVGAADFYYYRVDPEEDPDNAGDWLFFITEDDIPDEEAARPYEYDTIGFFSDESLTTKVSSVDSLAVDSEHEKLKITDGDILYVADDEGRVYQLDVGGKPSVNRRSITVTRIR